MSYLFPTNVSDEIDVEEFYESLNQTVLHIPPYACLVIGGDLKVSNGFLYLSNRNRNGQLLLDVQPSDDQHTLLKSKIKTLDFPSTE